MGTILAEGAFHKLQYEGPTTREQPAERGGLVLPLEAKAFAGAATLAGKSISWPLVEDYNPSRTATGPFTKTRVYSSAGRNEGFNVAHGRGNLIDPSNGSSIYSGDFHRGWLHGVGAGRVFEDTGVFVGIYKGQWAFGWRHGNGILADPDGSGVYVGEWKFDRKHGKGKEIDTAGAIYYGCWREGHKHGSGKLFWPNLPKTTFELQQWNHGQLIVSRQIQLTATDDITKAPFSDFAVVVDKIETDFAKTDAALPSLSGAMDPADIAPAAIGTAPTGPLKLEDKRRLKDLQEKQVPAFTRDMAALIAAVPFEVDWDSFTNSSSPATAVFMLAAHDCTWVLKPIKTAMSRILDTDLMKKEFAGIAKKIILHNKEKIHDTEIALEGNALHIYGMFSAGETSRLTADKLKAELDKKL
jgi:hypothetical protein